MLVTSDHKSVLRKSPMGVATLLPAGLIGMWKLERRFSVGFLSAAERLLRYEDDACENLVCPSLLFRCKSCVRKQTTATCACPLAAT